MAEATKPVKGSTDYVDQHKCLAMGEKLDGAPTFGCDQASSGSVKFGRKAAVGETQQLPGFPVRSQGYRGDE